MLILHSLLLSYLPSYDDGSQDDLPYFLEARVEPPPLVGRSVSENNLRALRKLFLAEVGIRDGKTTASIDPWFCIAGFRRIACRFVVMSRAWQHCKEIQGLTLFISTTSTDRALLKWWWARRQASVIKTLKTSQFRDRFYVVVVAIRRGHERLEGSLKYHADGRWYLNSGARKRFEELAPATQQRVCVLMNDLDSSAKLDADKSWHSVPLGFTSVIGLALLDMVPIIKGLAGSSIIAGSIWYVQLRASPPLSGWYCCDCWSAISYCSTDDFIWLIWTYGADVYGGL